MRNGPPRVARAIVALLTPAVERPYVLDDLGEEYELVARDCGGERARRWYWRQVLHSIVPLAWQRIWCVRSRVRTGLRARASEVMVDVRHGVRVAMRTPALTIAMTLTLALTVGVVTAAWSVVWGVLVRPLPLAGDDRVVQVVSGRDGGREEVSLPVLRTWREGATSFEGLAGYSTSAVTLEGGLRPERVRASVVTEGFADILSITPVLGRVFDASDHERDAPRVALLGHDVWRQLFHGDPRIAGATLRVDGDAVEIVGVLPDFGFPWPLRGGDIWLPVTAVPGSWQASRRTDWLTVVGVLREGASVRAAEAELSTLVSRRPLREGRPRYGLRRVEDEIVGDVRPRLQATGAAIGTVVLVACVNLLMLFTAWAQRRREEFALRAVLGGGGSRIRRQLFAETLLLGLAGLIPGLALAQEAVTLLISLYPGGLPRADNVRIDERALLVALGVTVLLCVLVAMPEVIRTARSERSRPSMTGFATPGRAERRTRSVLVVAQLGLSVALLTGGALLVNQFRELSSVDPGFRTTGVLTFYLQPSEDRYRSDRAVDRFYNRLIETLRSVPGIQAAGTVSYLPFRGAAERERVRAADDTTGRRRWRRADVRAVRGDYFAVMGARLLAGRWFNGESDDRRRVAVVNAELARRLFDSGNAVGRRIVFDGRTWDVIGVVGSMRTRRLNERPRAEVYVPGTREDEIAAVIAVRTTEDPVSLVPALRDAVHAMDSSLALADIATMDRRIQDSIAEQRFHATLLGGLSGFALLLAATGVYGLVAYSVSRRSRELGIRKALGERSWTIFRKTIIWALSLSVVGLALGSLLALAIMEWFRDAVPLNSAGGVGILLQVALVLMSVTLIAAWVPALRAGRVDPMITMREQGKYGCG